jgi:hypothetical protein
LVRVRLDKDRYAGHSQFWLEPVPAAGVVDEVEPMIGDMPSPDIVRP